MSHWGEGVLLLASLSLSPLRRDHLVQPLSLVPYSSVIRSPVGGEGRAGLDRCCLWSMNVLDYQGSVERGGEHPEKAGRWWCTVAGLHQFVPALQTGSGVLGHATQGETLERRSAMLRSR